MAALNLITSTEFVTTECSVCGIEYAIRSGYAEKRKGDHATFHCPNGHTQHFVGKSEAEKLREQLAAVEKERDAAIKRKEWAEQSEKAATKERDKARADRDRLRKRAQNGACPCCKRTFSNLARHMAVKHPETPEAGKAAVAAEIEERETKRPAVKA